MNRFQIEREYAKDTICVEITLMKEDIHVLITGGCLPHTGAVSMYCDGKEDGQIQPSGHKDLAVAKRWSRTLSEAFRCRVTAVCGIHYDNLTKEEIMEIVALTEEMLAEAVGKIAANARDGKEEVGAG